MSTNLQMHKHCYKRKYLNEKAGRLTVIGELPALTYGKTNRRVRRLICKCECGNTVVIRSSNFGKGTVSCGCYNAEVRHKFTQLQRSSNRLVKSGAEILYYSYIKDSERRGIVFNLSYEDFLWLTSQRCFYCGAEPQKIKKGRSKRSQKYYYNGVDRINNDGPYNVSNCVTSCWYCNNAKHDLPQLHFFDWIKRLNEHQSFKCYAVWRKSKISI